MSKVTEKDNVLNIEEIRFRKSPWMRMATKLYNDGREEFISVCHIARLCARSLVFPRDDSLFALFENMKFLEKDSSEFNYAVNRIVEKYNEAYSICQKGPFILAEVIPFPKKCRKSRKHNI